MTMDVETALLRRRSTRAFSSKQVTVEQIRELLDAARYAPSGGNLQPWHVAVLTGDSLQQFKTLIEQRSAAFEFGEGTEYDVYPKNLKQPYRARRSRVGAMLYETLGVAREDRAGKLAHFARNYRFFDAPAAMFFFIDRDMCEGQWADLGMFIYSIMLLATSRGLATCAQEAWANWHKSVTEFCEVPAEHMLFCGLALGHEDKYAPVNTLRTERADVDSFTRFLS